MEAINIKAITIDSQQLDALKAFMKALKIKFEISNASTYDPAFVKKIKKSKQEISEGNFTLVEKDNLQNFLGL